MVAPKGSGEVLHGGVTKLFGDGRYGGIGATQQTAGGGHPGFCFFGLKGFVVMDL